MQRHFIVAILSGRRPNIPLDTRRKLNVLKTSRTSSERLIYVQFTSCVQGERYYLDSFPISLEELSPEGY